MKPILLLLVLLAITHVSMAQRPDSAKNEDQLKLFIDGLDNYSDYIREHITFVNYVRDPHEADVHIIATSQMTGSGGAEYSLFFLGQHHFAAKKDTLTFVSNVNNTDEEIRSGLTQIIKIGLMRYVASFPQAQELMIGLPVIHSKGPSLEPEKDHWNNWVFTLSASGYLNSSEAEFNGNVYASADASKVTDEWKLNFSISPSLLFSHYHTDDFNYKSQTNSQEAYALVVRSITKHWSAGGDAIFYASTFDNYRQQYIVSPGIEYDFFPYTASTSRLLTISYKISPSYQQYIDTTLYGKTREFLISQTLNCGVTYIQNWGSVYVSLQGSNYLHDFSKNELGLNANLQWRIVKGLSVNANGYLALIHNQLNLPAQGASEEEILTQQRLLATDYSFNINFGISYTFGSIFNSIVNPRFGNF